MMGVSIYRVSYAIIAILISVSTILFAMTEDVRKKRQNRLFKLLVIEVLISSVMQLIITITHPAAPWSVPARVLDEGARYIYFMVHSALGPMTYVYLFLVSGTMYTRSVRKHLLSMIPAAVIAVMVILNPLFHWVYYLDDQYGFHRNWGEYLLYLVSAYYIIMSVIVLWTSWRVINRRRRWSLLFCVLLTICGVLIQLFYSELRVELMFEAVGFVGILITVEREDDRIDRIAGVYNRSALLLDMKYYNDLHKEFSAIGIRLLNVDLMQRVLGNPGSDEIIRMVADYLKKGQDQNDPVLRRDVYRAEKNSFMILCVNDREEAVLELAKKIHDRLQKIWKYGESEVKLDAVVLCENSRGEFSTAEDMILLIDGEMKVSDRKGLLTGTDLFFLKRNVAIEDAVLRGVAENRYEVYYQPIYDRESKAVVAAQSRMKLRDPKLGLLPQEEYSPFVIKNHLEDDLALQTADDVCTFISSGIPVELGVGVIGFRILAIQCLREAFIEQLYDICSRHDVPPGRINLQIHGFAEVPDREELADSVRRLHEYGFRLSMDRFGTEDSNLRALMTFDVDVVCIDISAFAEVHQDPVSLQILRNSSVDMVNGLSKKVLINGIVNEHQAEFFSESKAGYLQGDYFSEPVSQNEFIAVLKGTQTAWREEQRARARSEAKSSFLANMSHEIRTPINAILGMNEMILRSSTDREVLSYAGDIERAGRNLLSLINNVLDFSKIEAGSMELADINYELSGLINDVVHLFREPFREKGLAFRIEVDENLPDKLKGDEVRIRQAVTNILNNALKYTDTGSVTLLVGRNSYKDGVLTLDIRVKDTGRGIKEEDLGKLFENFQRLDPEKNSNIEGSGLGLAITAGILQMMGGKISVESEYGKGSTFRLLFPQRVTGPGKVGNLDERYRLAESNRVSYQESFIAKDAKILAVDDTPMNLKVIKGLLRKTLIRVEEAESGPACLEKAKENDYDLILLDYKMPEMDGIETLHRLRTIDGYEKKPVIALTANALSGSRESFLSEGFDDYLAKPVEGEKLEEVIRTHLPEEKIILRRRKGGE
ncbi:MAG: EAL domain-containing protein [Lachnospiraceae bacterium]|nr:EAL domain-containing protein [Lachnospiraceae bacterium]